MSLCSLFVPLSSSSPSFAFLPWVSMSGQVRSCSAKVSWTARQTSLAYLSLVPSSRFQSYPSVLSLFLFTLQLMLFPPFLPLSLTLSFHHSQLKSWLFWTEQERLIFFPFLFSPPAAPQHVLSFCCAGQSRPAVAKLSFLCVFPFSSALWLLWSPSYCEPQPCQVLLPAARPFTRLTRSSRHFSYQIVSP